MTSSADSNAATFEQRRSLLEGAITRQSLHRELLYKTLAACQTQRELTELETIISEYPEFAQATQSPYHLISVLVESDGLERILLDAARSPVTPERLEGLTEDERDDLIDGEAYLTTALGSELVERHAPRARLRELMEYEPTRAETYRELLAFCAEQPRTYGEIQTLLDGREVLIRTTGDRHEPMQPSVFVDKLQRSAGLVWQGGWITTEEGTVFLSEATTAGKEQWD